MYAIYMKFLIHINNSKQPIRDEKRRKHLSTQLRTPLEKICFVKQKNNDAILSTAPRRCIFNNRKREIINERLRKGIGEYKGGKSGKVVIMRKQSLD